MLSLLKARKAERNNGIWEQLTNVDLSSDLGRVRFDVENRILTLDNLLSKLVWHL